MKEKKALILVNTGSPEAPTPEAVARYLLQFLSDPRIIPLPAFFWQPVLRLFVVPRRKAISAARYRRIWTKEGSPLIATTERLVEKLQKALDASYCVTYAMRYGSPSVETVLTQLAQEGYRAIDVMPLYAQEASETRGSVRDAVNAASQSVKKTLGVTLRVSTVPSWYSHPLYIKALENAVKKAFKTYGKGHVLLSFHGIPVKGAERYVREVTATVKLLRDALGIRASDISFSFQSKFGNGRWLGPNTSDAVRALAQSGVKRLFVACPGFSVDCLESLEEIALVLKEEFLTSGGEMFHYIESLNDSEDAVALYADILTTE